MIEFKINIKANHIFDAIYYMENAKVSALDNLHIKHVFIMAPF